MDPVNTNTASSAPAQADYVDVIKKVDYYPDLSTLRVLTNEEWRKKSVAQLRERNMEELRRKDEARVTAQQQAVEHSERMAKAFQTAIQQVLGINVDVLPGAHFVNIDGLCFSYWNMGVLQLERSCVGCDGEVHQLVHNLADVADVMMAGEPRCEKYPGCMPNPDGVSADQTEEVPVFENWAHRATVTYMESQFAHAVTLQQEQLDQAKYLKKKLAELGIASDPTGPSIKIGHHTFSVGMDASEGHYYSDYYELPVYLVRACQGVFCRGKGRQVLYPLFDLEGLGRLMAEEDYEGKPLVVMCEKCSEHGQEQRQSAADRLAQAVMDLLVEGR